MNNFLLQTRKRYLGKVLVFLTLCMAGLSDRASAQSFMYYADSDGDGFGDAASSITSSSPTPPAGYVTNSTDCNDGNANVFPGTVEICNNIDDDCDGATDEGLPITQYFVDADGDTWGSALGSIFSCLSSPPPGYIRRNNDCNDNNPLINPSAPEVCNNVDDDCDFLIDEGVKLTFYLDFDNDGFGSPMVYQLACTAPTGYVGNNNDCNDNAATTYPGAPELCNGLDDDCDGFTDNGVTFFFYYQDSDGDGFGNNAVSQLACSQPPGYVLTGGDCNDAQFQYTDTDGDSYGAGAPVACGVTSNNDCAPTNPAINPGATEVCDGVDNDCDGLLDNADPSKVDNTPPVADAGSLADVTAQCSVASITAPTATDNCTGSVAGTPSVTFPITAQGTTVVTWTYDDGNGNTSTQTQNVVIDDTQAPLANAASLSDVAAQCSVASITAPTATDNCVGSVTGTPNVTFPIAAQGTTVVIWTYDDGNGNTSTQTQNVVIDDTQAPVADAGSLADVTAQCSVASITAPTATDNCVGSVTGTPNVTFPITAQGTTVVIWTYDDGNGNTSTQTQNVVIDDTQAPVADAVSLADVTAQCSVASITAPTATDNCVGSVTGTPNVTFPITAQGTTVVIWTYDDGNGNTSTQTQNVVIDDTQAPVADVVSLADVTAQCSVASITAPTASDNCTGSVAGTPSVTFPITAQGTTVVTWTYDDGNGNTSTQTQNVVIDDTQAPVADAGSLADVTAQCSVASITAPTASDNCTGSVAGTPSVTFPITAQGTTVVTWTYDDGNGNTSTQTQNVVIDDTQAPVADAGSLADVTAQCSVASITAPTASDNCTGSVAGTPSVTFPITAQGTTVVTWTYDDGNGNTSTQTQNVVIDDTQAPVADAGSLADVTAQCSVASITAPTATDNCVGSVTGTPNVTFPITAQGTTVVTWTYDDGNGNTSIQTQSIVIDDTQAPVADAGSLADVTAQCSVASITAPTASDNCTGSVAGTPSVTFPITAQGTTVVTWTYDDGNGNTSTQIQNVIITDTQEPVVSGCPSNITQCGSIVTWTAPSANDNCSIVSSNASHTPGNTFSVGTTTVTYSWTDIGGNTSTCSFDVTVTPTPTWYLDADADGYYTGDPVVQCTSPGTGYTIGPVNAGGDCDDSRDFIYTGATELCNGFDDDCDGTTDENTVPALGSISGPAQQCVPLATGSATFSVVAVSGVTSYMWTVPAGITIISGQGTNSIFVSWTGSAIHFGIAGVLTVTPMNNCGGGTPVSAVVDLQYTAPVMPPSISGPAKVCPGDVVMYSTGSVARVREYIWSVPAGMSIVSGQGTQILTVSVGAGFTSGTVAVAAINACGSSPQRTKAISRDFPMAPAAINGQASGLCGQSSVIYSTTGSANASSYTWTVPAGVSIISGQGGPSITVNYGPSFTGSGIVSVVGINACGTGAARNLSVIAFPSTPGIITGDQTICPGATNVEYSVSTVPGTSSYNWTAPSGTAIASGQGSKNIFVNYGTGSATSLNVSLNCSNACGTSGSRSLGGISVNSTHCPPRMSDGIAYEGLLLYPNPAKERVQLQFNLSERGTYRIRITDITGRLVLLEQKEAAEGLQQIELSLGGFAGGVYYVTLDKEGSAETMRLMVE